MIKMSEPSFKIVNNVKIYDEPFITNLSDWFLAHIDFVCIVNEDFDLIDDNVIILAYATEKEYNRFVYDYFASLDESKRSGWCVLLLNLGGSGLEAIN
jgi:hypothetical protein